MTSVREDSTVDQGVITAKRSLWVAVAAVVITCIFWYLDESQPSLTVWRVSTTSLQPAGVAGVDGLRLYLDGKELINPHLSVLEVENDGRKPIASNAFEGPIEIEVSGAAVIQAVVTESVPWSLRPIIGSDEHHVILQPLLLNPGDMVSIAVLTIGGVPELSARGRILGVQDINVIEAARPKRGRSPLTSLSAYVVLALGGLLILAGLALAARRLRGDQSISAKDVLEAVGIGGAFVAFSSSALVRSADLAGALVVIACLILLVVVLPINWHAMTRRRA